MDSNLYFVALYTLFAHQISHFWGVLILPRGASFFSKDKKHLLLRFQIKGRFSCPYLVSRLVTVYTILLTHFFHGQLLFTICACFTKGTARAKQKGSIFTRGSYLNENCIFGTL